MKIKFPKSAYWLSLHVLLIAATIVFGILPQITNLNKNQIALSKNNKNIADDEAKIAELSKYGSGKNDIAAVEKTVNNLLPATKDSSGFVVQIEALGNELSIVIPTLTITESIPKVAPVAQDDATTTNKPTTTTATPTTASTPTNAKSTSTDFSMSFRSSYPTFKTFLEKIESFPRFTTFHSVSVSDYTLDTDTLHYDLKGNIYYGQ